MNLKLIESEILQVVETSSDVLDLFHTLPGLGKNPISTFPLFLSLVRICQYFCIINILFAELATVPLMTTATRKVKFKCLSRSGSYLKALLIQVANSLTKFKKPPEFKEGYHAIKSHRSRKKVIIAVCKMLLIAIYNRIN